MSEKKHNWFGYLYLAPALILITIFIFYPLFNTIRQSFLLDYNFMTGEYSGYGFGYYKWIFTRKKFLTALFNTAMITFISVPISVIIALLISVALNSIKKLQGFFQTVFFLPYVTNVIAIGLVFSFMFNQQYGIVNAFLGLFGIDPVNWKGSGASYWNQMVVLMTYTIWSGLPFKIIVFLSGLQSIDKQYYQAAQVDATPKWRVFSKVTVPLLSPIIMYITITSFIGAFKAYDSVIALFGPSAAQESMITVVWYAYSALKDSQNGAVSIASASSVVLFLIILIFTAIQMYINKKRVHY